MFTSPKVIAIDDQSEHLAGLANSLNRHGVACLRIHFTGDTANIKPCPDVRVIFADLHLGGGTLTPDHTTDFSTIGGLLERTIKPSGPYFIVLWTQYPDQATEIRHFLERLKGVPGPLDVLPLAKADHLDSNGTVKDEEALMKAIIGITEKLPQIGALFDWESRMVKATGSTVSSILELVSTEKADKQAEEIGRILARLAIEAVGQDHVDVDRFRAVNEALLPILADRIGNLRSGESDDHVWRAAFTITGTQRLSPALAAKLNRMVHIADPGSLEGSERGCVIPLPTTDREDFENAFGVAERDAAPNEFRCKDFAPDDERFRWVLVQAQAACDHAQRQPGPVPCFLGLDFPEIKRNRSKKPSPAVWTSPAFEWYGEVRMLRVSARFPISKPSADAQNAVPIYRLREQILNDLIYQIHSYGARPGKISF